MSSFIFSSPLVSPNTVSIAFNVVDVAQGNHRYSNRQGVCTGWLEYLCNQSLDIKVNNKENPKYSIYFSLKKCLSVYRFLVMFRG